MGDVAGGNCRLCAGERLLGRMTIVLVVLLVVAVAHPLILRMLAWPLVASDSSTACDYFCIQGDELGPGGYEPFDAAAAWLARTPGGKVLLILPPASRVVEIGAVRSFDEMGRSELAKRGVRGTEVLSIQATGYETWDKVHALRDWLHEHPGATVKMACSGHDSGKWKYVFAKVLGPVDAPRVAFMALPDPNYPIESWWRSRRGTKDLMYGWLDLIHTRLQGPSSRPVASDAAKFQEEVRAKIGEARP
jgi:hypothetical protein